MGRATEAFHHRAAKLTVWMCGLRSYCICDGVPPKSCLDMVLSLHGRDLRELRFVRFRKGDKAQHLLEAFRRRIGPFSSPTYKTEVPNDCWVPNYELTMPRMDAVELWETSQAEALAQTARASACVRQIFKGIPLRVSWARVKVVIP